MVNERPCSATRQPASAKAAAIARPMPREEPVTQTLRPHSSRPLTAAPRSAR
ncbi:MAG: hypothetical protein L6W00_13460 [Lentisphaeria bacterium]|nr:MAG: hypothetical protein L6W00_13460 [Lentisphaeria bacterium]